TAAASLALTAAATASNIAEFQLESSRVLALITAEAASHESCIAPFPCPVGQGTCLIDHLAFPAGAALRRRPGATVPVTVSPTITVLTNPVQATGPGTAFLTHVAC